MKTIFKYQIPVTGEFIVEMPTEAEVLTVQIQFGRPCIWVLVDPSKEEVEERKFGFVGTGNPAPFLEIANYIGTVQQNQGGLIWHLFEYKRG